MILLRPEFLLLLLAWVPFCWWWLTRRQISSWQQLMDSELLSALQSSAPASRSRLPVLILPTFLLLAIAAISGPALPDSDRATVSQGDLYVVLDNSLSMAIEDVSPDRLTRAKRTVIDWARSGLFNRTSIITYSGSAHVLTPLTSDADTLELQLQSLSPFIMPQFGNRPDLAFAEISDEQLDGQHLLWLTDDINSQHISALSDTIAAFATATLVPLGTPQGGPIALPNDQGYLQQNEEMVIVPTDINQIQSTAQQLKMTVNRAGQLPDAQRLSQLQERQDKGRGYQDIGFWLLIPMSLLWLFSARHASAVSLLLCLILLPDPDGVMAATLFENSEQKAYSEYQNRNYQQAIDQSDNPMLQGQAFFGLEQYEKAARAFAQLDTADAHYNRGNALVHSGQYKEAIEAYDLALKQGIHPAAEKNKALVEDFLKQQNPADQESSASDQQQNSDSESSESESSNESPSDSDSDSENSADSQSDQSSEQDATNEQESDPGSETSPGTDTPQTDEQQNRQSMTSEELRAEQEAEAILNRLQPPESSLLQKKFQFQYQQNPTESDGTLW